MPVAIMAKIVLAFAFQFLIEVVADTATRSSYIL